MAWLNENGVARLWAHIIEKLGTKVDKIDGKGLSTNDYTTAEQTKLAGIAEGATRTIIDGELNATSLNAVQNKLVTEELNTLSGLVGDTSVATQIATALDDLYTGQYVATASSNDGVAYTTTVPGINALTTGVSLTMVPSVVSTSTEPTLNVNGLGAKPIRRRLSNIATSLQPGYTNSWLAVNSPFTLVYDASGDGNWIVEGFAKPVAADIYGPVERATGDANGNNIIDTYATIAMLQSMLPKVTNITLSTEWQGAQSPYYQDVALSFVTDNSMVDIQPTAEQLASWQDDGLAFTTLSYAGNVRVYVAGGLPTESVTVQVKVQEVAII